jgi:hypothetical protein
VAAAAGAGARMVTHLFNAQPGVKSREPGVVGQALADPRLTSGIIVDTHHVATANCTLAFTAAPGRICLVTDAAACAGMPPGEYLLGGEPITLPPGPPGPHKSMARRGHAFGAPRLASDWPGGRGRGGAGRRGGRRVPGARRPDRPAGPGAARSRRRGRPGVAR